MINFDVSSINAVENLLLGNFSNGFAVLLQYAMHLLYYFITFEIIFSGLAWAFYQSQSAERLFFQLIKIGLIFFFIQNYAFLLNSILQSVFLIGKDLGGNNTLEYLANPGMIWQYGYNFGVSLLQLASTTEGFAMPMILVFMGFGILLVIGIFGIQILLQVLAFYCVSAMSILMLPLSVFSPLRDFFAQSVRGILQAAIRLMVQMLLVSAAISAWSVFQLQNFSAQMNLNAPLGLFFTGLLFVLASAFLPRLAAKVVGNIRMDPPSASTVSVSAPSVSMTVPGQASTLVATMAQSSLQEGYGGNVAGGSSASFYTPNAAALQATSTLAEDFFRKRSSQETAALSVKTAQEMRGLQRQHLQEIRALKEAFYEALAQRHSDPS